VRELADRHGAVLVFDETITGFRFHNGGAQALFGVTPDLATFGKGIANGFPLSALAGRRELMMEMEEIFFSTTMAGEVISLAAARATLDKLVREPVTAAMRLQGERIKVGVANRLKASGADAFLSISGDPTWSFLAFTPPEGVDAWALKTLFLQEIFARGLLSLGTHNLSYSHGEPELEHLFATYDAVFPLLADAVSASDVERRLRCEPLQPLFKVR
jgi:glutamate-1-semialdehyde 2,1-aminomutase